MRRLMTGVALMGLAAGCASTASAADGKNTTKTQKIVVTHDSDDSQSQKIEVRIEGDNVVKFLVNGEEVDLGEVDWADGFVSFDIGDGIMQKFFVAGPDEDFDFSFGGGKDWNQTFGNAWVVGDHKAVLGVQVEDAENGGIFVVELTDGGAAMEAGILAGDIILQIDGDKSESVSALLHALEGKESGDKIKLLIKRGDDKKKIVAKLKAIGGAGGNFAFFNEEEGHTPRVRFGGSGGNWAVVAPDGKMKMHKKLLRDRLHDVEEHRYKIMKKLQDGGVFELDSNAFEFDFDFNFDIGELEGPEGLHMIEALKGELHELKMLDEDDGAFAWSFRNGDSDCQCDCDGCADCQARGRSRSWAPRVDALKRRMHVEMLERGDAIKKHKLMSREHLLKLETKLKHAHKALENIEIDIDMPEIEVLIERLDGSGGNIVFVPDAPKMRSHFRKHNGDNDVKVEVAPRHIVKRLFTDEGAAEKLERESRLARFEERLERLERMLKKLLHENDD